MTMPPPSIDPTAPPGSSLPSSPPFPLHYAAPSPRPPLFDADHIAVRIARRIVFALGCALLAIGLVSAWSGVQRNDAPYFAGWGAGLVALVVPLWRRP
jgi:hypothetical protein